MPKYLLGAGLAAVEMCMHLIGRPGVSSSQIESVAVVTSAPKLRSLSYAADDACGGLEECAAATQTRVYHQLFSRIVRGELPGGSELKSTRLAAELGVSRTPVVQAIARLLADGIVTQRMNMRAVVRPGSENWLLEIHELRLLLEPAAAARAAREMPSDVIDQLDRQAAEAAPHAHCDWAFRAREFDFALHLAIADHAANEPLRGAIYKCWQFKRISYELGPDRQDAILRGHAEHQSIVAAIRSRDAATAAVAMDLHLRHASSYRPGRRVV